VYTALLLNLYNFGIICIGQRSGNW